MSRAVGWVSAPSDIVKASIDSAQRKSFFILKQSGPTSFIIRDSASKRDQKAEGNGGSSSKNEYKVTLGAVHSCTCFGYRKEKALCRHICWIILKKFKIPVGHPLTYQAGYVPREIDEILSGVHIRKEPKELPMVEDNQTENDVQFSRRDIDSEDVCPICQEELLAARLPVTWCRACSNAAHIRCMKVWAEHQETMARGDSEEAVQCPYCRQEFAPKEHLRREFANTWEAGKQNKSIHKNVACSDCSVTPIKGKLYISTRGGINLCGKCYRNGARPDMNFNVRDRPGRSLKPAKRILQNRNLELELQGREITENDYEQLLNLDRPASPDAPGVPDHILNLLPCHRVGNNKRLLKEGIQCLICLNPYQPTQYVKKLPNCNHYFHRDCIDTWLQNHRHCPVDHQDVNLKQKSPQRSKTMLDILDHRHKTAPRNRTQKRIRLLDRRNTVKSENTLDNLLVTRPIAREPVNMIQQGSDQARSRLMTVDNEMPELINPIPLINLRMRNFRF